VKGGINPYFSERLDAAAVLYHSGRVKYIIASGDNSELSYNEPRTMMSGLRERGVPAENIFLDYAGFRTLDSIVRAREIFGQDSITVISQRFHNERAVYIGRSYGITVYGFNANDSGDISDLSVRIREVLARFKAFIDVKIIMEQPKFLGDKIIIP
jgi:SanA protein